MHFFMVSYSLLRKRFSERMCGSDRGLKLVHMPCNQYWCIWSYNLHMHRYQGGVYENSLRLFACAFLHRSLQDIASLFRYGASVFPRSTVIGTVLSSEIPSICTSSASIDSESPKVILLSLFSFVVTVSVSFSALAASSTLLGTFAEMPSPVLICAPEKFSPIST